MDTQTTTQEDMMKTTITTAQIQQLRDEAGQAGDLAQVAICDAALAGDADAHETCAAVIADARAQG